MGKSYYLEPMWTLDEMCDYMRMTRATVRKLAETGEIPAHKIGRQWRFLRTDLVSVGIINEKGA